MDGCDVTFWAWKARKGHGKWQEITTWPGFLRVRSGFCGCRDFLAVHRRERSRKSAKTVTNRSEKFSKSHGWKITRNIMGGTTKYGLISKPNKVVPYKLLNEIPNGKTWERLFESNLAQKVTAQRKTALRGHTASTMPAAL